MQAPAGDAAAQDGGSRAQMLLYQNTTLAAQLEVQRKQLGGLEAKVEEAEKKQAAYEETLACVDRMWTQLNADLAFMTARAREGAGAAPAPGSPPPAPAAAPPCRAGNGTAAAVGDLFLERLLRGGGEKAAALVRAKAAEVRDESTDVEAALAARAAGTRAVLAGLLDAVDAARAVADAAAAHAGQPNGVETEDALARARKDAAGARGAADAQKAVSRVLQERVRRRPPGTPCRAQAGPAVSRRGLAATCSGHGAPVGRAARRPSDFTICCSARTSCATNASACWACL